MPARVKTQAGAAVAVILLVTGVLYPWRLDKAPVYLGWDEARTAVQAYSLATTGRDMNDSPLPFFFHITDPLIEQHSSWTWWQPMLFYLTAAVLTIAPLAEWSVRLPNVVLALMNVWLAARVARRLFDNEWYGPVAAAMLGLTPAHFFFARLAQDYFLSQTFALLWLLCVLRFLQTRDTWLMAAAGVVLGLGFYTHISSWIVMPFYLGVASLALAAARAPVRAYLALGAAFAAMMLPLAASLVYYPNLLRDMFQNYSVVTTPNADERVSLYWDYFNPSYLFFSGGTDPMWATRRAGVFLLAFAALLPCGIWHIFRHRLSIPQALVLIGFFFAPVPIVAALPEAPRYATARDLLVIPFGVLIATAGIEFLVQQRRVGVVVAAVLLLSMPLQFALYVRDYFGDYQLRSSYRHDFLNVRGVVEYVTAADESSRVPVVLLSDDVGAGKAVQWKFHLITHDRTDLWHRTRYFSAAAFNPDSVPAGSLLVLPAKHPDLNALLRSGRCSLVHVVHDVTDQPAALILRVA
jgi:4-amino-4-deoxy-L-arabinose transferase-like glycosyltransferase